MSEAEFQAAVVEAAQFQGWRVFWIPDWVWRLVLWTVRQHPRRGHVWSPPGFPDLVMVKGGRLLIAELKSARGAVRAPQQAWLDDLRACGLDVRLWRPQDVDAILEELRR